MFGFSFGELIVLIVVAIVVIGPKDLPKVLRKAGQWSGKLRRMAADLRAQSGIDDVLRAEGLSDDINEIRKLARGELDQVRSAARVDLSPAPSADPAKDPYQNADAMPIDREREFPREGADSYRALPDTAIVYAETLPVAPYARDALYMTGDANGVLPALPAEAAPPEAPLAEGADASPSDAARADAPPADAAHADASRPNATPAGESSSSSSSSTSSPGSPAQPNDPTHP